MDLFRPFSVNIGGSLFEASRPLVMGILNATPDSFYQGSRTLERGMAESRIRQMIAEGVDIIDIGGCSTRPGFEAPPIEEEMRRVMMAVAAVKEIAPEMIISVDTYRGAVAREAVYAGAHIINDISAFTLDKDMRQAVIDLKVPYILTHPSASSLEASMSNSQAMATVISDLQRWVSELTYEGVNDIIIDPGFGFGKTLDQNFLLLDNLEQFKVFDRPVLVGISRKSMINKTLGITADEALNGTTVLNTIALTKRASILRVHDVSQAIQAVKLCRKLAESQL